MQSKSVVWQTKGLANTEQARQKHQDQDRECSHKAASVADWITLGNRAMQLSLRRALAARSQREHGQLIQAPFPSGTWRIQRARAGIASVQHTRRHPDRGAHAKSWTSVMHSSKRCLTARGLCGHKACFLKACAGLSVFPKTLRHPPLHCEGCPDGCPASKCISRRSFRRYGLQRLREPFSLPGHEESSQPGLLNRMNGPFGPLVRTVESLSTGSCV